MEQAMHLGFGGEMQCVIMETIVLLALKIPVTLGSITLSLWALERSWVLELVLDLNTGFAISCVPGKLFNLNVTFFNLKISIMPTLCQCFED